MMGRWGAAHAHIVNSAHINTHANAIGSGGSSSSSRDAEETEERLSSQAGRVLRRCSCRFASRLHALQSFEALIKMRVVRASAAARACPSGVITNCGRASEHASASESIDGKCLVVHHASAAHLLLRMVPCRKLHADNFSGPV